MNCCLCNKKIPMFGNAITVYFSNTVNGQVCEECYPHFQNISDGVHGVTIDDLEESYKYFIGCASRVQWNQKFSNEMLTFMSVSNNKISSEKAKREKYFPQEGTVQYGEDFIINTETSYFAILKDGYIQSPHAFDELLDYEVREDGNSVTSGRAGSAIVGTLLVGTAGAIIGSSASRTTKKTVDKLELILNFKGYEAESESIVLINRSIDRQSETYDEAIKRCDKIVVALKQILKPQEHEIEKGDKKVPARAIYAFSVADEIRKFKELMDEGIITREEFQNQKTKLLNLDY